MNCCRNFLSLITLKEVCFSQTLLMLAALISNRAACLACGLAGCLALAAATFLQCILKVLCVQTLDMLH